MIKIPTQTFSRGFLVVLLLAMGCVAVASNPASDLRVKQAKNLEAKMDAKGLLSYSKNWTDKHPNDALAWYYLGHAYELLGQTTDAINAEHRALRFAGNNHLVEARIWAMIGQTYANADKHEKSMDAALHVMPYEKTLISARAWYSLGLTYGLFGLNRKEIDAYTQALGRSPQSALLWDNLGGSYFDAKEYSKAASVWQHAARLAPNSARVWDNLGSSYIQAKEYSKAADALQHAVNIDPNSAREWEILGGSYYQANEYSKAADALQHAVNIDPSRAKVWGLLGASYGQANEYSKAADAFQHAVNLDPNDRKARYALRRARAMENHGPDRQGSPVLKYSSVSCARETDDFIDVDGEVKNVSNETYDPEVTATFSTSSGALVTSAFTYPQYQPLMAGQTSAFQVLAHANPNIASVDLGAADQTQSHPDYDARIPTTGQKHATCN